VGVACDAVDSGTQSRHHARGYCFAALGLPVLLPLLNITKAEFRQRFRGSPVKRARRSGLRRNAAI